MFKPFVRKDMKISVLVFLLLVILFLNTFFSLENALRSFACLTVEDLVEFKYNDKVSFVFIKRLCLIIVKYRTPNKITGRIPIYFTLIE